MNLPSAIELESMPNDELRKGIDKATAHLESFARCGGDIVRKTDVQHLLSRLTREMKWRKFLSRA